VKSSVTLLPLLLDFADTLAELPAEPVVTVPTAIAVAGDPCGPVGPMPPGVPASDAVIVYADDDAPTATPTVSPVVAVTFGPLWPLTVTVMSLMGSGP
jgi:hypothetical protein